MKLTENHTGIQKITLEYRKSTEFVEHNYCKLEIVILTELISSQ